jgi:hypothetical protein
MKLHLTAQEFRAIVSTGVAAGSDLVTPVLMSIQVSYDAETNQVTAMATDRYRIARNVFTPIKPVEISERDTVHIPAKELQKYWNSIKINSLKSNETISLEVGAGESNYEDESKWSTYTISYAGQTISGEEFHGNFPPIERLMPDTGKHLEFSPAQGVLLKPAYLADLGKLFAASDTPRETLKDIPWSFFTEEKEGSTPRPVYITRKTGDNSSVEYLVQPNLILR